MAKKKSGFQIVVIPDPEGSYENSEGERYRLHQFPAGATVSTRYPVHKAESLDDFLQEEGYWRLQTGDSIPDDTPFYKELTEDERFSTKQSLLANREQLQEITGIGPATADDIINHVTKSTEGE